MAIEVEENAIKLTHSGGGDAGRNSTLTHHSTIHLIVAINYFLLLQCNR